MVAVSSTSPAMPPLGFRGVHETVVKKSRFIATVARVDGQAEARAVVAEVRRAYPDARHHCVAWSVETNGVATSHSSDDGEPAGTAGVPMLKVLLQAGLVNIAVVVTRYFGGIKLGASGLTRAYGGAVSAAIGTMPLVARQVQGLWELDVPMAQAAKVAGDLRRAGAVIIEQTYDADSARLVFRHEDDPANLVAQATQGTCQAHCLGTATVEVALPAPG